MSRRRASPPTGLEPALRSLTPDRLLAIYVEAVRTHPAECCGLVTDTRVHPSTNHQDALHRRDPDVYPRSARTAFSLAPADQLRLARSFEGAEPVRVLFHSHADVGAYFSDADRAGATLDGRPLYPDLLHLVVDARAAGVREARAYFHADDEFREVAVFDSAGLRVDSRDPPAPPRDSDSERT